MKKATPERRGSAAPGGGSGANRGGSAAGRALIARGRRDGYMKIKGKIKHLQKLQLNIFPVNIKHSLDKKFSKLDKTLKTFL